ncbi:6-phosphogluconolactonase [Poriferisphaera sp. WC338]|uniref:6-phosphogluconolactonase n=1 Tax=Poriferisphaera sp. WC338 TaxID=3425129 RepID=UPI003D81BD9C
MIKLPGQIQRAETKEELFDLLGKDLIRFALDAIGKRGAFHLALSGGGTPEPFYRDLVIDPRYRTMPWEKTHIWIVDERRVPFDDEKSNIKMIRETLTDHVPIVDEHVHPMPVMNENPDDDYEAELRRVFGESDEMPQLDLILLGMGGDCHTASLFPHSDALHVNDRMIVRNEGPNVTPPDRVTMTYPFINAARNIGVLVVGASKHEPLQRVAEEAKTGQPDIENVPISGIKPTELPLIWYADHAALLGE